MIYEEKKIINPAAGAIVMAIGIFLYGAWRQFFTNGAVVSGLYLLLTLIIYLMLIRQSLQKGFWKPFLSNPVNSFVIGSWVAGLAVLSQVILKYLERVQFLVIGIAGLNTLLCLFFFFLCLFNFKKLWLRPTFHHIHGVILLSTVSIQSLVITWANLFPGIPTTMVASLIIMGILIYLNCSALLFIRYKNKTWAITDDWTNTNCILHGALSITGLAAVSTGVFSSFLVTSLWWFVLGILLVVEGMELVRAYLRVKKLGWHKGVCTYHVSQWSRNFTFGMFYAFTMVMLESPLYTSVFSDFQQWFLYLWGWVVAIALIYELILWIYSFYKSSFETSS
ncbi:hypothetical protein DXT76_09060 [Halobacillus trueperi]|uniref:Voltage-dependent anion channel n=2 Tax=Halobacillus TaxID=45667 RepID=A0A1H0FKR9_HALAD|nr:MULTISPECIES: hypothetical protein [Halobacillus]RDY71106.1 hypothetical protein DXT76_09060 [Halobacillus trueperi]SDN95142.1 Voltage-dependent anion channel [Halobacillus aidingensis]